ncbi:MAG: nucleoside-triphosphatase [Candidatus Limnocylindrales bacterium]
MRTLVLLTGAPGSGKTTACARLADQAERRGRTCEGLLSPARFSRGRKSGIDVVELRTGVRRRLAEVAACTTGPSDLAQGPAAGRYQFHAGALAWAARRLNEIGACDVLIVDEIGPLELERGEGWANAIQVLRAGHYRLAVATVRPALVQSLRAALGDLPGTALVEETVLPEHDVVAGLLALA